MRILVTGATGMLGYTLLPVLKLRHEVVGLGSRDCDIRDEGAVRQALRTQRPEFVIHLAAYTDVDGCESDPLRAEATNGSGTRYVAQACAEIAVPMLYLSTDYVFDGSQDRPYVEEDPPNPLNVYGRSKLLGEGYVRAILQRYFIVRTSWLYGPNGKNFVATIFKLARQQREIRVVADQRGSPTYTRHLASKLAELVETKAYGIYHVTGSGSCSWFDFAREIVRVSGPAGVSVLPISSKEAGRLARRPANSVLENRRLRREQMTPLPDWKWGLKAYLAELGSEGREDSSVPGREQQSPGWQGPRERP